MSGKTFLDSNILVYAHDAASPAKRVLAESIILDGLRTGSAVISTQVLCEFLVTITRKIRKPMALEKAKREIGLLSYLETVETDVRMIERAIDLQERWRIHFWDGLILSAAERAHCAVVLSEDLSDGQAYGRVTVRNPFVERESVASHRDAE